ncbi:uncharacterized protein G2W53_015977 [Senna tora]|uniref:Uncharacterized protein n=1 Tax=Senna tora TaxID=362788 RepID=A0A834WWJ4_9FABA|nr:uncharacterized protein G2W53_015977 [Senna tora]
MNLFLTVIRLLGLKVGHIISEVVLIEGGFGKILVKAIMTINTYVSELATNLALWSLTLPCSTATGPASILRIGLEISKR